MYNNQENYFFSSFDSLFEIELENKNKINKYKKQKIYYIFGIVTGLLLSSFLKEKKLFS